MNIALIVQITDQADRIIYTGAIDEFFSYRLGRLRYNSIDIDIEIEEINLEYYQNKVIWLQYSMWTRSVEFKYLLDEKSDKTVVSWESVHEEWDPNLLPCRPLRTRQDRGLYLQYAYHAKETCPKMVFCGRF